MGVEDQLQVMQRPGFGVIGTLLEVKVNCFRALVPDNIALTVYDGEICIVSIHAFKV